MQKIHELYMEKIKQNRAEEFEATEEFRTYLANIDYLWDVYNKEIKRYIDNPLLKLEDLFKSELYKELCNLATYCDKELKLKHEVRNNKQYGELLNPEIVNQQLESINGAK